MKRPYKASNRRSNSRSAGHAAPTPDPQRVQKILAAWGVGSRRDVESWIAQGRVQINGQAATPGQQITGLERIELDGRRLKRPEGAPAPRVLAYYKPEGQITTRHDPEGRPTVFDKLPNRGRERWIAVGRLDVNTLGLLLLTNDGELANRLMHPRYQVEREYAVRILGVVTPEVLEQLTEGVELDDGRAHFQTVEDRGGDGANHWYHVTLTEGRNRAVRRIWEAVGCRVSRLIRVRYGSVSLRRGLKPGKFDELDAMAVKGLRASVGLADTPTGSDATGGPRHRTTRRPPGSAYKPRRG